MEEKQTYTKVEMAERMGISIEVLDKEIENAGVREAPPMNRATRRRLGIQPKKRGR